MREALFSGVAVMLWLLAVTSALVSSGDYRGPIATSIAATAAYFGLCLRAELRNRWTPALCVGAVVLAALFVDTLGRAIWMLWPDAR